MSKHRLFKNEIAFTNSTFLRFYFFFYWYFFLDFRMKLYSITIQISHPVLR